MRSRVPSSWRTKGIARRSAARVMSRSAGWPITLTHTFAWRRSAVVSTLVIVTNPTRGSATSRLTIEVISWRRSSSTRSVRWLMVPKSPCQPLTARLTVCDEKHSMMSPSTMSWKSARPMPHS